ncbi:DUF2163 domain-containing protein [Sphingomonas floccifaciens]|uniref:DUF2163 domain-containing protein n=1 Tax=Sphingomonas floccifaciens TaxID=1844115 RepID=A0ABW4NE91_9SPHN
MSDPIDPLTQLIGRTPEEQAWILSRMTMPEKRELRERWFDAHALGGQKWPEHDWRIWLILAGRGFGKTRAGSEWLSEMARRMPDGRFALVGGTADDVRRVMIEGAAGLLAVGRDDEAIVWRRDRGEIEFASGAKAFVYSAGAPESLRGPEHHLAWCDELAKWRHGAAKVAWDNLQMGLRLGERPRVLVTTTPRPGGLLRAIEREAGASGSVMRGRTRDNPHLPQSFVAAMLGEYGGTRLGRQELDGELIDDVPGALWTRARLETCRVKRRRSRIVRVVVGVDPPAGADGDACGIVAVALGADDIGYVLEDASVAGATPEGWARAVAACVARHKADRVVAEKNQGGDMVKSVLLAADARLPLKLVHASRGKVARAEPVTAHDRDLTIDGSVYRAAPGMTPSAIRRRDPMEADTMDVAGALSSAAIREADLIGGRWDGARVAIFAVDWTAPDNRIALGTGTLGAIETADGAFTAELRGSGAAFDAPACETTSPECRAELGDRRCRVSMAGRRTIARVTAVDDDVLTLDHAPPVAGAWDGGRLRWLDGANAGIEEVVANVEQARVRLSGTPRFEVAVGDRCVVIEGCDKSLATCAERFGNAANFRGEPFLPGIDLLTRYPPA